jgi:hypothetical protein
MIIQLGRVTLATKAVMPSGSVRDPIPLPTGKHFLVGRIL